MRRVKCPECGSTSVNACVRVYLVYEVRGVYQPRGHSSQAVVLEGRPEEIESGLDEDFKCRNPRCGAEFSVPEDVRLFRRHRGAPLEDCNT